MDGVPMVVVLLGSGGIFRDVVAVTVYGGCEVIG
jgi:hypothetical protein